MDLPDCPPGAEGYQDSVFETPKKPSLDGCTKAEQEFQDHLNSLKIKVENGEVRSMVERRGRDVSGKWIYLCYPCAAVCSGESILQTHISGKKHKTKLSVKNVWPQSIFDEHPFIVNEKGGLKKGGATEKILQKMAEEVDLHNNKPTELDVMYNKYRTVRCHIQESVEGIKAPLIGLEYLIEHPPEQVNHEPTYICVLCSKQGHPRTIMNHMTCFWHRYNYLVRHYPKALALLHPYRAQMKYREGVNVIINRLAQRIEDKYGRLDPVHIDKEEYDKDKERIHQWIFKGFHFSENSGVTFEEVVDIGLITSLHQSNEESKVKTVEKNKDPSPPVVPAPSKPQFNNFTRSASRQERRAGSQGSLSDISDDNGAPRPRDRTERPLRSKYEQKPRYEPYHDRRRESPAKEYRSRYALKNSTDTNNSADPNKKNQGRSSPRRRGVIPGASRKGTETTEHFTDKKAPNYAYKVKLAEDMQKAAEESAKKTLAYHEKNPEKHPLYPEEWKKFWNRRYKEIQAEGKDPSKHDFKPEWIVFWTSRMKELHDEELRVSIHEIYRKLCLPIPDPTLKLARCLEPRRKSPDSRRRSPEKRRRSPEPRRRSPEPRRRSPEPRRRSPEPKRRSPEPRRRSPEARRRSPYQRVPSYDDRQRDRRSPARRLSSPRHRSPERRHSPTRTVHLRSRSPLTRTRSPARTHIVLESAHRSRSPLSRRDEALRNRSPQQAPRKPAAAAAAAANPDIHTVMISDDELKADNLSPWDSDNDLDSLGSLPDAQSPIPERSRTGSVVSSHASRSRRDYSRPEPQDHGAAENVVATLRLLVALEDYLGSIGPKVVDLMTEALKMEKDKANSSEELLERESAVVLIETAKEKLKGAAQAGLVPHAAAAAVRNAVVRAAATLHAADTRARKKLSSSKPAPAAAPVPVAGVGTVDRVQIAQQMAAALIAQGKTDVSSEELAQLVDAVVGMAEAKKRETEVKKKIEARATADKGSRPTPPPAVAMTGTASALQMLQSAYDENDKKIEKEDAPDAMDGLSDSDLETLLKNFNELSAEEQHSLIAYLKKLEAREPQRVERLRQYVSAAATSATPAPKIEEPPEKSERDKNKPVTIESDDDDYTVEEVFQSATQKVKEDQIRQEMEIVKKSLEESKVTPSKAEMTKPTPTATDLLALVQASIQSTSTATPVLKNQIADVVASNTHPRSFGDSSEAPIPTTDTIKPLQNPQIQNQAPYGNQGGFRQSPNQMNNFGGNRNLQSDSYNQTTWEQRQMDNMQDNRGQMDLSDNRGSGNVQDNRTPLLNISDNPGPTQDSRGQMNMLDNRGNMSGSPMNMTGPSNNMSGPPMNMSGQPMNMPGQPMNMSGQQMNMPGQPMNMSRPPMHMSGAQMNMSDNRGPMNMQDNQSQPLMGMQQNRGQMNMTGNRGPMMNMSDNRGPMMNMSDNRIPVMNMPDNRGMMNMMDTRGPPMRGQSNFGNDLYNQGPRGNFMHGRMQDNYNPRPQDMNSFGNNNFRGRGGGRGFGGPRGRGRGYY